MEMSRKDKNLIEYLDSECLGRIDSIKEDIKDGYHGLALGELDKVEVLLETIRFFENGSTWDN